MSYMVITSVKLQLFRLMLLLKSPYTTLSHILLMFGQLFLYNLFPLLFYIYYFMNF